MQVRVEVLNLLNRPNFATPDRIVFAAADANEAPLATAGRINRTITSSRQVQLGVKVTFLDPEPLEDERTNYFGSSIRTISEFSRVRSNTMAFPSGVTSKVI